MNDFTDEGMGELFIRSGGLGDMLLSLPAAWSRRRRCAWFQWLSAGRYGPWLCGLGFETPRLALDGPEAAAWFSPRSGAEGMSIQPLGTWDRVSRVTSFLRDPEGVLRANLFSDREVGWVTVLPPPQTSGAEPVPAALWFLSQVEVDGPVRSAESHAAWSDAYPLRIPEGWKACGMRHWRELGVSPGAAFIAHPGSGSPRKNLDEAAFFALVEALREAWGLQPVLLMGPAEEERLSPEGRSAYSVAAGLDLCDLTGFLACGPRWVVTHDSGIGHLAGALGLRVVSMFVSTDPRVWAPWFPQCCVVDWGATRSSPELRRMGVAESGRPEGPWLIEARDRSPARVGECLCALPI